MVEIRYNTKTGEVTGWWGSRFGNHDVKLRNRPDEAIVGLDIPIPDKPTEAWLCDGVKLTPNPDYVELDTTSTAERLDNLIEKLEDKGILPML